MNRTSLVSVRMPLELVKALDAIVNRVEYLNRSFVINHLLTAMVFCSQENALQRILSCYDPVSDGIRVYALEKS